MQELSPRSGYLYVCSGCLPYLQCLGCLNEHGEILQLIVERASILARKCLGACGSSTFALFVVEEYHKLSPKESMHPCSVTKFSLQEIYCLVVFFIPVVAEHRMFP